MLDKLGGSFHEKISHEPKDAQKTALVAISSYCLFFHFCYCCLYRAPRPKVGDQRHLPEQTPDIPGNLIGH
jgi:hypothetical protein